MRPTQDFYEWAETNLKINHLECVDIEEAIPLLIALLKVGRIASPEDENKPDYTPDNFDAMMKGMGAKERKVWAEEHGVPE